MTIRIDGIVGYDVLPADIRAQIASAGDTLALEINSPGGDVHDGIDIANALRAYRRNGGTVTAIVTGLAASMATYIAMQADSLTVEDNAVFMVHNPWSLAMGDYRSMRKSADILKSLQSVLGRAYAKKTGRDMDAIRAEMDEETWLFGDEIVSAGYADALVPAGDGAEDRSEALAIAQTAFATMPARLRESADTAGLDRIAALLPQITTEDEPMTVADTAPDAPESAPVKDVEQSEDREEIRAEATKAERARVVEISAICEKVGMSDLAPMLVSIGASIDHARAMIIDALADRGGPEIRQPAQAEKTEPNLAEINRRLLAQVAGN